MTEVEQNGASNCADVKTKEIESTDAAEPSNETKDTSNVEVETTDLEKKIIKQMEFYFGDMNFSKDKFLQEKVKENEEGWVSMEIMLKFNRLRELSDSTETIVTAMKKSSSGLMEVHEDGLQIRRNPAKALPEYDVQRKNDLKSRTLYVKRFPLDTKIADFENFFEKYSQVEHIKMRKNLNKEFKGSVFVTFGNKDGAKKFLESGELKYLESGENLIKMYQDDYFKIKTEEKKKGREQELKDKEEAKQKAEEDEEKNFEANITKGAIVELTNLPDVEREELKQIFNKYSECAWVDLYEDKKEARLRFTKEGEASVALTKAKEAGDGKIMIKESEVQGKVLEGDEEVAHWKKFLMGRRERRNKDRAQNFGKRGRCRRHGGPPKKKARMDN